MTNTELYQKSELKLATAKELLEQMNTVQRMQEVIVEDLETETNELYSKLTDEEKESLEIF